MRRLLVALAVIALMAGAIAPAMAQQPSYISGTLNAACSGNTCPGTSAVSLQLPTANAACTFNISGTYNGTIIFEQTNVSPATGGWASLPLQPNAGAGNATSVTSASFYGGNVALAGTAVRARMSSYSSGSAAVQILCGTAEANALVGPVSNTSCMPGASGNACFPVFSVTAYGAKCDGSTNDATAIQTANTAASAAGGVLFFPAGQTCVYNSATPLTVGLTETIYGVGSTFRAGGSSTTAFSFAAGGHSTTFSWMPWIFGFTTAGILLNGAQNVTFWAPNILCGSGGVGILMQGSNASRNYNNVLSGGVIHDCADGIRIDGESSTDWIAGNTLTFELVDLNTANLHFYTASGSPISPSMVNENVFNIYDNEGATNAVLGDANFNVPSPNYLNVSQQWGAFSGTPIVFNGSGSIFQNVVTQEYDFNGAISAGNNTCPVLTFGDICASRSTNTGAMFIGGSTNAVTCDFGVNIPATMTCNKPLMILNGGVGWRGGPTLDTGSGAPVGTCVAGSIYTRNDSSAAANSEMYVCRNVTGTGTWEAVTGG